MMNKVTDDLWPGHYFVEGYGLGKQEGDGYAINKGTIND